jgi:hypothetical protein
LNKNHLSFRFSVRFPPAIPSNFPSFLQAWKLKNRWTDIHRMYYCSVLQGINIGLFIVWFKLGKKIIKYLLKNLHIAYFSAPTFSANSHILVLATKDWNN